MRWVRENAGANWPVVPASSYVEQVAVRREPIAAFANWSPAAKGLEHLHQALEAKLDQMGLGGTPPGGGQRALPGPQSRPHAAPQAEDGPPRLQLLSRLRDTARTSGARNLSFIPLRLHSQAKGLGFS